MKILFIEKKLFWLKQEEWKLSENKKNFSQIFRFRFTKLVRQWRMHVHVEYSWVFAFIVFQYSLNCYEVQGFLEGSYDVNKTVALIWIFEVWEFILIPDLFE